MLCPFPIFRELERIVITTAVAVSHEGGGDVTRLRS